MSKIYSPEEIQVGQFYVQNKFVYLGVGMRKLFTDDQFTDKKLLLVDSEKMGCFLQEGENLREGVWEEGFNPIDYDMGLKFISGEFQIF